MPTKLVLATTLCLATAACVTGPISGSEYDVDPSDGEVHIPVGGFVRDPGARVVFEAYDWVTNTWKQLPGAIQAATKATFEEGAMCKNSPPMYAFHDDDFAGFQLFLNPYWDVVETDLRSMRIRAHPIDGGNAGIGLIFTDDPNADDCVLSKVFTEGCDFYAISAECGYNLNEATIYARD